MLSRSRCPEDPLLRAVTPQAPQPVAGTRVRVGSHRQSTCTLTDASADAEASAGRPAPLWAITYPWNDVESLESHPRVNWGRRFTGAANDLPEISFVPVSCTPPPYLGPGGLVIAVGVSAVGASTALRRHARQCAAV